MKSIKRLLTAAITAMLCLSVFALTLCVVPAARAYAEDEEGYPYYITVNSGKEGVFSEGTSVKLGPFNYGATCRIDIDELGLEVNDPTTYYARGLKISGHDNDEASRRDIRSFEFPVTGDESFSVAYALNGTMVKYVVNYVAAGGGAVHDSKTFYGMVGDYPVVSYQAVEGYLPDAYNKGKTLVSDESKNVFTFVYSRNAGGGTETETVIVNGGTTGGNAGAGGGTPAGAAGQPAQFVNLDDNQTPTTDPGSAGGNNGGNNGDNGGGTSNIDDQNPPTTVLDRVGVMPFVLGGGLLAALIALIAFLRTRGRDDDEEVADELEDMYIDSADGMDKLSQADPEQFKTSDPDELKEAFKELGKKE